VSHGGEAPSLTDLAARIAGIVGLQHVLDGTRQAAYATDAGESRGLRAAPDLVVRPGSADEVAATMAACHERGVAVVPRGGGTGLVGGSLAFGGGVVIDVGRLNRVLEVNPAAWRMTVGAGLTTTHLQRIARENGLYFPPDPGAAENSQIGGNVATDAGGPHAFKYGTTGSWVTGLEMVIPPGRVVAIGGANRKDVTGYDLVSLMVGSEGTLGIITECTVRLIPAPRARAAMTAVFPTSEAGCEALLAVVGSGLVPSAIDFLDRGSLAAAHGGFPAGLDEDAGFMLIVEVDGDEAEVDASVPVLEEVLGSATQCDRFRTVRDQRELWRWRDTVTGAVRALRGGKLSADVSVPAEHFQDALAASAAVAGEHGLDFCAWGHAGDANLHSTFVFDPGAEGALARAATAADHLLVRISAMGGSIAAEHGVGWAKSGRLSLQLGEEALRLHRGVKELFDPDGLLNPGKKS
jgi:glycolate oxidase subunit GlcD